MKDQTHLFVHDANFGSGVAAVLFEDRAQVPALKLSEASDDGARAVPAQIAHDEHGVGGRLNKQMERLENNLLRDGVPCIGAVQHAEVMKLNVLVNAKVEAGSAPK